ncbi:ABC transporter permease [Mucilaginibacter terrae]|uniref:ABC transport system permease protein n=1 Tax=Mucilaginibacter terrae TaxID=1955052 RepID=A0ABU3H0K1_9SPHI|nr:FtsX-like permease family protein [Mucilaginibacter terrae]MDT3405216.1 putative ABC transport system permease protein [Mucilaginibacter terrae]
MNHMQEPVNLNRSVKLGWLFKMAWRDSRRNRSRLFLFVSSIILGIAALVAIYSFGYNLRADIDNQAATLVGADLVISGNHAPEGKLQKLLDTLGSERSQERNFASMVLFTKSKSTRLVQIRALQGGYPYYGSIETVPAQASHNFRKGRYALIDASLMEQFNARINDSVKIGKLTFAVAGVLKQAPGQSGLAAGIAPVVYIPLQYLEETGLVDKGSRLNYNYYYKFNSKTNVDTLAAQLDKQQLDKANLHYETIQTRKENTGRVFGDLNRFLSLVGFVALLLGCIGVASATQIYVREKVASIAILRCLGIKASEAFLIFLIQIAGLGLIGSVVGAALGTAVQQLLPIVLKDFIPFDVSVTVSWLALGQGVVLGVIISVLFALLPLISIRNISPLNTLRSAFENAKTNRDPLRWLVYLLILGFMAGFSYLQLGSWQGSAAFTVAILIAFLILTFTAILLMRVMRLVMKASWSYLVRQGFANLYRPNNQTIILMVSIGLSTAFICLLIFVQSLLIKQVTLSASGNQPNMILFDIQTAQEKGVVDITDQYKMPVIQQVPIVTIRIDKINGKTAATLPKDSTYDDKRRAFGYEYRVTYRDKLISSEKIASGKWIGEAGNAQVIPVSVDERMANRLNLKLNDKVTFNVQGTLINTFVANMRKVNWNRLQTNFQVVFPTGVLEQAPQFHVLLTHVPSTEVSAKFQSAVVSKYPNVSIVDLGLVLTVLDEILNKIGYVIRFMSGFSIATGIIVLIASVRISKYQRIKESVLLRTLGGSRRQILWISALEYLFLGALSSLTGILLAVAGGWLLAKYTFDVPFDVNFLPAVILFGITVGLTIAIGLLNSRGVLNRPPLEVLRSDT